MDLERIAAPIAARSVAICAVVSAEVGVGAVPVVALLDSFTDPVSALGLDARALNRLWGLACDPPDLVEPSVGALRVRAERVQRRTKVSASTTFVESFSSGTKPRPHPRRSTCHHRGRMLIRYRRLADRSRRRH